MPTPRKNGATIGDADALETAKNRNVRPAAPETEEEQISGANEALGLDEYTWTAPDGFCSLTFRRAPGGTAMKIARILGPAQAQNPILNRMYRALASVVTFNGENLRQPNTDAQFRALMQRFGPDGFYDDNFELYCVAWEVAMNPEMFEALAEAEGAGLSPDDVERIAKNAGLSHTKKLQRQPSGERQSS